MQEIHVMDVGSVSLVQMEVTGLLMLTSGFGRIPRTPIEINEGTVWCIGMVTSSF